MTTGIFFIQVFGFLLQTYPIAILSFFSFSPLCMARTLWLGIFERGSLLP